MQLKILTLAWIVISVFLSLEYAKLNELLSGYSYLDQIFCKRLGWCRALTPDAGHNISYTLGWVGFGLMVLTNVYIIRKRYAIFSKFGKLQSYLDWHIFFGLLGPTLILFHCNFKVRGLVSIAFWSMVVSFLSGIIGRYFYMQLLQAKTHLKTHIESYDKAFEKYLKVSKSKIGVKHLNLAKSMAFSMALGGAGSRQLQQTTILNFLAYSFKGDMSLLFRLPPTPWPSNRPFRKNLRTWARMKRRLIFLHYYKVLFGYWRTFHSPFAVFMYVVTVIHIISSLIFKVH